MKQFIICPNCGAIELATIEETVPFWSYIHNCTKCEYIIMESDWEIAKAISIKQPWTYLIATGIKPIEKRTWKTKFRGRILLHAGAKPMRMYDPSDIFTREQWESLNNYQRICVRSQSGQNSNSAIIGSVEIVDCVQNHPSIWAEKSELIIDENKVCQLPKIYNWVLKDPILFEKPVLNVKGKLSFFIPQLL